MSTGMIIFLVVLVVLIGICVGLYFFGKKAEKKQAEQKEQMDAYLSRGMDAVELTAITVEYMLRENYSGDDILNFLTQESKYYKRYEKYVRKGYDT